MNHSTRGGDARKLGSNFRCNRNLPRGEGPHHRIGRIEFANRTPEIQGIALSTNMADHAAVSPGHLTILLKCGLRRKRNKFLRHVRTIPLLRLETLLIIGNQSSSQQIRTVDRAIFAEIVAIGAKTTAAEAYISN